MQQTYTLCTTTRERGLWWIRRADMTNMQKLETAKVKEELEANVLDIVAYSTKVFGR